jgi:hypothetical protein
LFVYGAGNNTIVTPVIEELFVTVEKPATAVKAMLMQQHQEGQQQQERTQQLERQQQQGCN